MTDHILRAPVLDDTSQQHLFRVICDKGREVVDCAPEMSVGTAADNRFLHAGFERGKNGSERSVIKFAFEFAKGGVIVVFSITCDVCQKRISALMSYILLGMARNTNGITVLRCARRMLL